MEGVCKSKSQVATCHEESQWLIALEEKAQRFDHSFLWSSEQKFKQGCVPMIVVSYPTSGPREKFHEMWKSSYLKFNNLKCILVHWVS